MPFVRLIVMLIVLLLPWSLIAQTDQEFVAWAKTRVVPIDSGGSAFRSLDASLEGVRLIGVGESVHDAEPFLSFRLQLLQDLVRRHQVTAVILESGFPEAMTLNDYVHGRTATVDYKAVLPGGNGSLATLRTTMEWIRAWNLGEGRGRKVSVFGADLPRRSGSIVPALDRLAELTAGDDVTASLIDAVRPTAVRVTGNWWRDTTKKYEALNADEKTAFAVNVSLLVQRVQHLPARDDRTEWARRVALVVQQGEDALRLGMFSPTIPRDIALAENTLWVLRRLGAGERAVYWAHNAHVQKTPVKGAPLPAGAFPGSGQRFDVVLGAQYYAIGTTYGGPSMDDATAATPGSVDATLESVSEGPYLLLLRRSAPPPAIESWLAKERPMRFQVGYLDLPLGPAFDALVFFEGASDAARVSDEK
ncbi:MAG TPA: erythromycin esterase family protein [Thermoanaerobaculia bacterium]|nr:erythromycin esterase family protein [Thermoanaerobaculia bacterium]